MIGRSSLAGLKGSKPLTSMGGPAKVQISCIPIPKNFHRRDMLQRRKRICDYCGLLKNEEYSDKEREAAGCQCEECAIAELAEGTLDESC
jgi:hypothetical protein